MYKLQPTTEKVSIKWIVWHGNEKDYRSKEVMWGSGYDFECSCGYVSNYGAGTIPTIKEEIQIHKVADHNYKWEKEN